MSWNHAKNVVAAPFAVWSVKQAAPQKSRQNFRGLILPRPDLSGQYARSGLYVFVHTLAAIIAPPRLCFKPKLLKQSRDGRTIGYSGCVPEANAFTNLLRRRKWTGTISSSIATKPSDRF